MWVYGICEGPGRAVPRGLGLADAPLEGVAAAGLLAVVSRHEQAPGEPSLDALCTHERVVEQLMEDGAVLPMRFGTTLPGADALRAAVDARRDELAAALARVRGRVELGVRVQAGSEARDAAPAPATSGRDYLMGRLAADSRSRRLAATVHEPLAALAVAGQRQTPTGPGEVLRAAYLVDADAVAGFRAAVERLQHAHPELALLCTGPWPPYSFAAPPEQPDRVPEAAR